MLQDFAITLQEFWENICNDKVILYWIEDFIIFVNSTGLISSYKHLERLDFFNTLELDGWYVLSLKNFLIKYPLTRDQYSGNTSNRLNFTADYKKEKLITRTGSILSSSPWVTYTSCYTDLKQLKNKRGSQRIHFHNFFFKETLKLYMINFN